MSFCKGVASTRMLPRVPRDIGSADPSAEELTTPLQNVTINPIEGDKVFMPLEKQPPIADAVPWRLYGVDE